MSAERLIASHLRLAAEALAAAEALLAISNRNAVYQAEQAVEQVLLALAQADGIAFTRSQQHQLETMRRMLPDANPMREHLAPLTWLEAYATAFRYPRTMGGLSEPPGADKIKTAVVRIGELIGGLGEHFSVDLDIAAKQPAAHSRPPR